MRKVFDLRTPPLDDLIRLLAGQVEVSIADGVSGGGGEDASRIHR